MFPKLITSKPITSSNMLSAAEKPAHKLKRCLSTIYWILGGFVIIAAMVSFFADMTVTDMLIWVNLHFGKSFTFIYLILVAVSVYAIAQLYYTKAQNTEGSQKHFKYWRECGLHAANGVSTIALTFTLLGISVGIGALAEQPLTPESVQGIIGELTAQFSIAFMTTVIGLPTAAAIRAWVAIKSTKMIKDI